jgi:beta-aspartyl-peptidase (threonine type)
MCCSPGRPPTTSPPSTTWSSARLTTSSPSASARASPTVAAVCLDADGALAAATSTGGRRGQLPGRIGDTPTIGAGTWADERVAVSCTGDGESFVRAVAAHGLAMRVEAGATPSHAADQALADVGRCDGTGGLICVDAAGEIALPFTSGAMNRGAWREGSEPQAWV